jgi:hypothetical protein
MLAQLTGVDTVAKTDLAVPRTMSTFRSKSGEGFKSLIGAYKTDAKMLGWKMKTSSRLSRASSSGPDNRSPRSPNSMLEGQRQTRRRTHHRRGGRRRVSWRLQAERLA